MTIAQQCMLYANKIYYYYCNSLAIFRVSFYLKCCLKQIILCILTIEDIYLKKQKSVPTTLRSANMNDTCLCLQILFE